MSHFQVEEKRIYECCDDNTVPAHSMNEKQGFLTLVIRYN